MTILIKYIEKIKIAWLSKILASLCLINDFACFAGVFVMPFIKYPEKAKILFLIFWSYAAVIFCVSMIVVLHRELKTNQKEIDEYKKDKVVYIVGRLGALLYFVSMFCLIFLARNDYMNISLLSMIGIAVLGLLLFAIIIAMLTQYKNNYVKMAKDTINFLFAFFVVILFSILMFAGILAHGNENFPKYFSEFLVGISAIPLLLGGIYLVCKMFLSSKMLNEKSDALPISIVLFIAIGIVTCILLRYAITDDKMQEIMTTIFASILGGAITLAGVAWTIKDANVKRQEDLKRIQDERKEEERKKHIPYIRVSHNEVSTVSANISKINNIDLSNYEDRKKLFKRKFVSIYRINVLLKNISSNNIILHGAFIDGTYYKVEASALIEQNSVCKIDIGDKSKMEFADEIKTIDLHISDMFENFYKINCILQYKEKNEKVEYISGNEKFYGKVKDLVIVGFSLPEFMREDV